jgi:hypothetical protein
MKRFLLILLLAFCFVTGIASAQSLPVAPLPVRVIDGGVPEYVGWLIVMLLTICMITLGVIASELKSLHDASVLALSIVANPSHQTAAGASMSASAFRPTGGTGGEGAK